MAEYSKKQIAIWNALLKEFRETTKDFEKLVNEQTRYLRNNKPDPKYIAPSERKANKMRAKLKSLASQVERIPKDALIKLNI